MTVAILGCGPTGLIAAHACAMRGIGFVVLSKKRKSQLYGSQYLHEPIPGITPEDSGELVRYVNIGTPEEYRRKTHGKFWDGIVAPEDFETEHWAWNIREAYDRLWRKYAHNIIDYEIPTRTKGLVGEPDYTLPHPAYLMDNDIDLDQFELVISTVPRKIWTTHGEDYIYSEGWALGDAPEEGRFVPYEIGDMTICCNGRPEVPYNRLSKVFGYSTIEWPQNVSEYDLWPGASKFIKPLRYHWNHDGPPSPVNNDRWLHVGRYGKWMKGVVVTDAWHDVNARLTAIGH
jgi:hypothetical protein